MKTTGSVQVIDYEQATSNRRLVARIVDLLVVWFVLLPLGMALAYLVQVMAGAINIKISNDVFGVMGVVAWVVIILLYDTGLHRLFGKTLGKKLLGIRVVDVQGEKLGWGKNLLRAVVLYISILVVAAGAAITASIIGWVVLRTLPRYGRFPHDKVVKGFVVREVKGVLVPAGEQPAAAGSAARPSPLSDLERMRAQGMISQEEYERKKREL